MTWEAGEYGDSKINKTGIGMPYWDSSLIGPTLAQKAIDFIDETHQMNLDNGTEVPFFVYLSSPAAHGPHTPPDDFLGTPVKGVTGMSERADMIYELDVTLGKLIEAAEERGLLSNTMVIFTSDNGGTGGPKSEDFLNFGHDAMGGLNGSKGEPMEGGFRVPLVVKWGDKSTGQWQVPPGTVRDQVICGVDLAATFAAIGGNWPGPEQANDSYNMLEVFLGDRGDDDPVRGHLYLFQRNQGKRVIREGDMKLIINYEGTVAEQLYDLAADPFEATNLLAEPGHQAEANRLFKRWQKMRGSLRTAPYSG
jgi:arylsulfatase A-like enzyme